MVTLRKWMSIKDYENSIVLDSLSKERLLERYIQKSNELTNIAGWLVLCIFFLFIVCVGLFGAVFGL